MYVLILKEWNKKKIECIEIYIKRRLVNKML